MTGMDEAEMIASRNATLSRIDEIMAKLAAARQQALLEKYMRDFESAGLTAGGKPLQFTSSEAKQLSNEFLKVQPVKEVAKLQTMFKINDFFTGINQINQSHTSI
jgi:hypothetical protein